MILLAGLRKGRRLNTSLSFRDAHRFVELHLPILASFTRRLFSPRSDQPADAGERQDHCNEVTDAAPVASERAISFAGVFADVVTVHHAGARTSVRWRLDLRAAVADR
jgi:hypothetical protein